MRNLFLAVMIAVTWSCTPVFGAVQCAPRELILTGLAETYGETRQAIMLDAANSVIELFASPETGTWTLLLTKPGGPTCQVASGEHFERINETLSAPESDL